MENMNTEVSETNWMFLGSLQLKKVRTCESKKLMQNDV